LAAIILAFTSAVRLKMNPKFIQFLTIILNQHRIFQIPPASPMNHFHEGIIDHFHLQETQTDHKMWLKS